MTQASHHSPKSSQATGNDVELTELDDTSHLPSAPHLAAAESDSDGEEPGLTSQRPLLRSGFSSVARRPSFIDEEDDPVPTAVTASDAKTQKPVTWMSLPKRGQLAVLTFARLSEPLSERSLAAYMFYQLRSFDTSLPDSTISSQGGLLTATFAAAQFLTAVWWGRAADSPRIGRKRVLLVGLTGTCLACVGVGFAKSFTQAMIFRTLAGALNGNIGVMRTMISEIIKEKKYQSRAFLLMPMCFNIGVVIGPIMGGFAADPIHSFPGLFGENSVFGGEQGVGWMAKWPYALPQLVSSFFILMSAFAVIMGLDETHPARRDKPDYGRKLGRYLSGSVLRRKPQHRYTSLDGQEGAWRDASIDLEEDPRPPSQPAPDMPAPTTPPDNRFEHPQPPPNTSPQPKDPPKPKIFTTNVLLTLATHFVVALHVSAFNALIFILLCAALPKLTSHDHPLPLHGRPGPADRQSRPRHRHHRHHRLPPADPGLPAPVRPARHAPHFPRLPPVFRPRLRRPAIPGPDPGLLWRRRAGRHVDVPHARAGSAGVVSHVQPAQHDHPGQQLGAGSPGARHDPRGRAEHVLGRADAGADCGWVVAWVGVAGKLRGWGVVGDGGPGGGELGLALAY